MSANVQTRKSFLNRCLDIIERVGDKLPHPFTLFWLLAIILVFISHYGAGAGWQVQIPGKGDTVAAVSLISADAVRWFFINLPKSFINFGPVGVVLLMTMMIGIGEEAGFFSAAMRHSMRRIPRNLLTFGVILLGVVGNLASDAGIVIIPALGGLAFMAAGRNPIVGLVAAYAGVSGGFTANLFIANADVVAMGITQAADEIYPSGLDFHPAMNWYFMMVSTVVLASVGTWVTEKLIEPRVQALGGVDLSSREEFDENDSQAVKNEKRGLLLATIATVVLIAVMLACILPADAILRDVKTGELLPRSPFMSGIFTWLVIFFFVVGTAFGIGARTIRSDKDLAKYMAKGLQGSVSFFVIAFAAAEFVALFGYTNLGPIMAIKGAKWLETLQIGRIPIIVLFILLTAFINLFIYSMSAKWALLAPIFVPMFTIMGINPATTQAAYRVADSATNIITPLFAFAFIVLTSLNKYKKDAGLGTLISLMLPYSIALLISWMLVLIVFMLFNIPLGPGMSPYL